MPELGLELLEAVAALLDQRHLVAHREQRARDVRADLAAAGDDRRTSARLTPLERRRLAGADGVGEERDRRLGRADRAQPALA